MNGLVEGKHICLTFKTNDEQLYAVSAEKVKHIIPHMSITKYTTLPKTPEHIRGVMQANGDLLPIVDLEVLLGNAPSIERTQFVIVLEHRQKLIGVLARRIVDFISFSDDEIDFGIISPHTFMHSEITYLGY